MSTPKKLTLYIKSAYPFLKDMLKITESDTEFVDIYVTTLLPGRFALAVCDLIRMIKVPTRIFVFLPMDISELAILSCATAEKYILGHTFLDFQYSTYPEFSPENDIFSFAFQDPDDLIHRFASIIAENTGKPLEDILSLTEKESVLSAEEIVEHGFADGIITDLEMLDLPLKST